MGDATDGFRVRIERSAIEANRAVAARVEADGRSVVFDTREAASRFARRCSSTGDGRVAIQRAAPQDERDVDAYVVARPERRTHDPDGSLDAGLTFDTTGNQYGAIGEALILATETDPPVLSYYAREDLDVGSPDRIAVAVDEAPAPVTAWRDGDRLVWVPDCEAVVRAAPGGRVLRRYLCEIKTGGGSFERDQRAVMEAVSRHRPVLAIRVDISDLPGSYSVRFEDVGADGGIGMQSGDGEDVVAEIDASANARLDEF